MKIAVLTGCLPNYNCLGMYTIDINKGGYCSRHGYDLEVVRSVRKHFADSSSHAGGFSWSRLEHMAEMVESGKWEWVWCVGCDTLITNMTIRLESITGDTNRHVVICGERVAPIQADSFLVRNSTDGSRWLRSILSMYEKYKHHGWVENQAMIDSKGEFEGIIQIVPQHLLNSYDYRRFYHLGTQYRDGTDCYGNRGQWMHGDFLIHWPASTLDERLQFLNQYTPHIVN